MTDIEYTPSTAETHDKHDKIWEIHKEKLRTSAITIEYAEKIGMFSGKMMPEARFEEALRRRGMKPKYENLPNYPGATYLAQPYQDCVDKVNRVRLRMDQQRVTIPGPTEGSNHGEKVIEIGRYLIQSNIKVVPWMAPEVLDAALDTSVPMFAAEAPLKAASLSCNGYPSFGLGGVMAGAVDKKLRQEWGEVIASKELQRIQWKGRRVYVVFDAFVDRNPHVAMGAAWIWRALSKLWADVWIVMIPPHSPSDADFDKGDFLAEKDQGVDDFIYRYGKDAFQKLVDEALPMDPETLVRYLALKPDERKAAIHSLFFQACLHVAAEEGETTRIADVANALPKNTYGKRELTKLIQGFGEKYKNRSTTQEEQEEGKGLVDVLEDLKYYKNAAGRVFATIDKRAVAVDSARFHQYVANKVIKSTKEVVTDSAIKSAVQAVVGPTDNLGIAPVPIRYGYDSQDGTIWVDLADRVGRYAHVTPKGVRIEDKSPVSFFKPNGMLAMPSPIIPSSDEECKAAWDEFWDHLQLGETDHDPKVAIFAWLMSAARPETLHTSLATAKQPFTRYSIGVVTSEHGAGKTSRQDAIRILVDPHAQANEKIHEKLDDVTIYCENTAVASFDNVSYIDGEMSNHFCRIATGSGSSKRTLFSDRDLTVFSCAKPIIMNGITDIVSRLDLLDRSVLIRLPKVTKRMTDTEVAEAYQRIHARVLGALFHSMSRALRDAKTTVVENARMIESAQWAAAAEQVAGFEAKSVEKCYQATSDHAAATVAEEPIVRALLAVIDEGKSIEGMAADILDKLTEHEKSKLDKNEKLPEKWPKDHKALRSFLDRNKSALGLLGISIEVKNGARVGKKPNVTKIIITRSGEANPLPTMQDMTEEQAVQDIWDRA